MRQVHLQQGHTGAQESSSISLSSEHAEHFLHQILLVAPFCLAPWRGLPFSLQLARTLLLSRCLIHSVHHSFQTWIHHLFYVAEPVLRSGDINENNSNLFCFQRSNSLEEDKNINPNHRKHCPQQCHTGLLRPRQGHKEGRVPLFSGMGLAGGQKG